MSYTNDESVWVKLARLPLPKETWGICRNAHKMKMCATTPTMLGDGYCQKCWDNGFPRKNKPLPKRKSRARVLS